MLAEAKCKVLLLGTSGCGKTQIVSRFCENVFSDSFIATIGVDFKMRHIEDPKLKLMLWDLAGQERFRAITESYYVNTQVAIFVYSVNDFDSLSAIKDLAVSFRSKVGMQPHVCILLGNKTDLPPEQRQITFE